MGEGGSPPPPMPVELRVLFLLRARVPACRWDPRRVALTVADYQAHIDVEEVAAECADWIHRQPSRVKDPEALLRTMFKKAKAQQPVIPQLLSQYDRLRPTA